LRASRSGSSSTLFPWAIPRDLFARGIVEGIYVDDDPDLLARKMLVLKQVELTHWVDNGMETEHAIVLDRLESQFVRAFCTRDGQIRNSRSGH
jgi:hypothetical protein